MALRIGFDLDGVLANMEGELVRQAAVLFGDGVIRRLSERAHDQQPAIDAPASAAPSVEVSDDTSESDDVQAGHAPAVVRLNMTARQERRLWRHVESIENFWETLLEIEPGVVGRLSTMARDRRWEIIFLTKRPATRGATAQLQTQRWLESKGFTLPSVFVVQGSRGRIAAALALDIVVDDRPENCLDVVVDSKARALLIWRDDEIQLPATVKRLGIGVIRSVGECLDTLMQADSAGHAQPGVFNRVMRRIAPAYFGPAKSPIPPISKS
jgi:hypothetical protein